MKKYALVSVWDKTGVVPFTKTLVENGYSILSTGGTAKLLAQEGIEVTSVSEYTGHPEIMDGRVKTLNPKIHAGLLCRRDNENDMKQLEETGAGPIDFVVVNLYPFLDKVREVEAAKNPEHDSIIEFIDIGGPTMLRASAKNCYHVAPVCDTADYDVIAEELKQNGSVSLDTRRSLAAKVFKTMSAYDGAIARYFSLGEKLLEESGEPKQLAPVESIVLEREMGLRYGENPHQDGALYRKVQVGNVQEETPWEQLQGKELSYNNLLDMQGTLSLYLELEKGNQGKDVAAIIKHSNPCGAAVRDSNLEAFKIARDCDAISAFGGIVAISGTVDEELVQTMQEGFLEVVLAENYTDSAIEAFKKKKNVRVLKCSFDELRRRNTVDPIGVRNFCGDYLLQTSDENLAEVTEGNIPTERKPTTEQLQNASFAWQVCKHVKSNTIVIANEMKAIGVGAGQMSRVDAAKVAIQRAKLHGHSLEGAVAASDAFLPFSDTLEVLKDAGVELLVQPGGSIKDEDVIKAANDWNVCMVFTGERHFRH